MDSGDNTKQSMLLALDRAEKNSSRVTKYSGPSLPGKIGKLLKTPGFYVPYALSRFGIYAKKSGIHLFWGKYIAMPVNDWESFMLDKFGFPGGSDSEYRLAKYLINTLTSSDTFFDVGANYGFYTFLSAELCSSVHSFEPNEHIFRIISNNSKPPIVLNNIALSNFSGTSVLHTSGNNSGISTISEATVATQRWRWWKYSHEESVHVDTLDNYIKTSGVKPTVIKMDVEGAEKAVIEGGSDFLEHYSPIVILEVWSGDSGGKISMPAVNLMRKFGYISHSIDRSGRIHKVSGNLSQITEGDNFVFTKL